MTESKKNWFIALAYIGLIYSTLEVVGAPIAYLRSHGVLRFSLAALYITCVIFLLRTLYKARPKKPWPYAALAIIFLAYYFATKEVKTPEEQIHFFQYGLVGVLFERALESNIRSRWKTFPAALLLATGAGWIDEILQGHLPHRHYDVRDIMLNAVSAFLGLLIYQIVRSPRLNTPNQK